MSQIHVGEDLSDEQMEVAHKAAKLLLEGKLSPTQMEKRDMYIQRLGLEVDDVSASDFVGVVAKESAKEGAKNDAKGSTTNAEEITEKG